VGLSTATRLAGTCVVTVASAVRGRDIGERGREAAVLGVDAIADARAELHGIHENPDHSA